MTFSRRDLLTRLLTPTSGATRPAPAPTPTPPAAPAPARPTGGARRGSSQVEHIPVTWVLPRRTHVPARLALWLCGGIAGMNAAGKELDALADAGFVAISFDSWQRGTRAKDSMAAFFPRTVANFPQAVWPVIGNSALEMLRVLDWATAAFDIAAPFCVGGHALGGDIAIAAAGLDPRIGCIATIGATPDWRRPGMHADGKLVGSGHPDAYAQWFCDHMNPLTHLAAYDHRPRMSFECGADDDHVPADGALRFQQALLTGPYAGASDRLRVNLHPGVGHEYTPQMWDNCLMWFRSGTDDSQSC